jgi:translocation and assembly module TamA
MNGRRRRACCIGLLVFAVSMPLTAAVKIEVRGLSGSLLDNVKTRLVLPPEAQDKDIDDAELRRLLRSGTSQIRSALRPFGYYEPKIAEPVLEGEGKNRRVIYSVDQGEPTQVGSITTRFEGEGAQLEPLDRALQKLPLKVGERLKHEDYEAAKKRMSDAALAQGFLDARWLVSELRVVPEERRADIELRMETGPRYFFGPVTVVQDSIRPKILDRYIPIREGRPFDPQGLLDLQFALTDLGYFQTVQIEPQRDKADAERRVPILVTTTPRPRQRYDFGVGYGTDTGARASIDTQWRRLNRWGHTLNTDFQLSENKNTLAGDYRVPLGTKSGENLSFTAATETEKLDSGDTAKYVIGASLNRAPGDWQRRLYLEYTHEESDFGAEEATADLLTPGVSFTRTASNDPIFTRRGWYLFADLHGAQEGLLSNTGFLQSRMLLRAALPMGRRARLLGRAELGASLVQDFRELPASQRFFAGGDQSVRGYAYQSLGPKDKEGNVVGGRYLSTFSLESEVRIIGNWGGALFVDAGGASDDPGPDLSTGVGIGVRYRVPIGSLQIDLAHPLDDPDTTVRLHLGVRVGI